MRTHIQSAGHLKRILDGLAAKGVDLEDTLLVVQSSDPESDLLFGPYWVSFRELPIDGPEGMVTGTEQQVVIELGGV